MIRCVPEFLPKYFHTLILSIVVSLSLSACSTAGTVTGELPEDTSVEKIFAHKRAFSEETRRLEREKPFDSVTSDERREKSFQLADQTEQLLKRRGVVVIPELIKRLDSIEKNFCEKLLVGFGEPSVTPVIEYARQQGETSTAAIILSGIGEPCVEKLYNELIGDSPAMRELACNVIIDLAALKSERSELQPSRPWGWAPTPIRSSHCDEMEKAIATETNPMIREKLVLMLGSVSASYSGGLAKLIDVLTNDPDSSVCNQATRSLSALLPKLSPEAQTETCQSLIKQLEKERDSDMRVSILYCFVNVPLLQAKPPEAVLRKLAADPMNNVRLAALEALYCNYGDSKAVQKEMIYSLKQDDRPLREVVCSSVSRLTGKRPLIDVDPELVSLAEHRR